MIKDNNEYVSVIGTITFESFIAEQEVTSRSGRFNTKDIGECKIEVYGPNEGNVPHFHIFNSDKSFECCICIYSNNYFPHGGKYLSKLNSKQCSQLNSWMKRNNDKDITGKLTNWEMIANMWEANNPDCKFPKNQKSKLQPHYENMTNYKSE